MIIQIMKNTRNIYLIESKYSDNINTKRNIRKSKGKIRILKFRYKK